MVLTRPERSIFQGDGIAMVVFLQSSQTPNEEDRPTENGIF